MPAHALPALEELAETMRRSLPHGDRDADVPGHRCGARGMVAVLELDQVATGLHVGHPDLERLIIDTGTRDRIADRPVAARLTRSDGPQVPQRRVLPVTDCPEGSRVAEFSPRRPGRRRVVG